ncbi:MAG: sodium:calcium antiporter [Candidatus Hermodarchaeota archaeon]
MLDLLIFILLFIIGYIIIFFAADLFLDNLKEICIIYGLSPFVIGSLILGIDPEESIASIIAAINGLHHIAVGNVIGNSIIALTISFALPAFFYKINFKLTPQFYFFLLYCCMIFIVIGFLIKYGFIVVAIIVIIIYFIYLNLNLKQLKQDKNAGINLDKKDQNGDNQKSKRKKIILIIIGFFFIFLGGEMLIYSAEQIIRHTNLPEAFFGLVIIAFVTNVEELTLVFKSIRKKSVEIGLGGMIGKVFWNLAITFGISGIIIINFNFSLIIFWNWLILFILLIYFNYIAKKKQIYWKEGIILTIFLLIFLFLNFILGILV